MEVIGQIDIGTKIFQVDHLSDQFSLDAPVGSFIFDSYENVLEKKGELPTQWERTTFRCMIINVVPWAMTVLEGDLADRKELIKLTLDSIENFKGQKSDDGRNARLFLENDCTLVGFVSYIIFSTVDNKYLPIDKMWNYTYRTPSLVYKHNKLPFAIVANGLEFDIKKTREAVRVSIGENLIEVDDINANHNPEDINEGTFLFEQDVDQMKIKKNNKLIPDGSSILMMNILTWAITLTSRKKEETEDIIDAVFNSIVTFKKGETSDEGLDTESFILNECEILGFIPSITYIMPKERGEGSLDVFWEHPFSMPTILAKHEQFPFLIISNGNLDFDDSRLRKMSKIPKVYVDGLSEDDNIQQEEDDLLGFTG